MIRSSCWPLASLSVALCLLAGCGGGAGRAAPPATTPVASSTTTVVSPGTTETVPTTGTTQIPQTSQTTQSAANLYLALISPTNQMVAMYDAAADSADKLKDLQEMSGLLGLFAAQLQTATWPAQAQGDVASLITAVRATQSAADQLISNPTSNQTAAAFTASIGTLSAASSRVRLALGLPPVQ
jgi:hypothetical protein